MKTETKNRNCKFVFYIFVVVFLIILAGCADKQVIVKTEYKDVYVPVKCKVELPNKPAFDEKNPQTAKELSKYYKQIEILLKECIDE
ncbi:hypothetical protein [Campylobacter pinnipediorum]|uniref:Lipoprotein n=1 Tax=Campylobacter pinnipediorum subsp. pinnipediorum TaxID=1660067 RepID=A0AAX0L9Q4_9BACT|nr:hypothetical protein [Campylobacter pinnipediorum]AQW81362.1 hypothetical protein CPIN17260_1073 [Campylobacter pinnipediorum subsp. pinnipediorum]AQW82902.1 hypothetical protein CPIN17261_0893 [Campylobacter pinnipediorum subsp. pinnipediorum]AQW82987.1 hypothetical protein CPIN17261_0983 [Campylobacter pinnipediorum subsp. pinnipediorum]OPA77244.1 hypothetical protein BFG04_03885 [Campylobacter pinnipediorum subsp. pinnipediorum]OPA77330.1 hypothetical protein BFG04_04340 [Campylobacter p